MKDIKLKRGVADYAICGLAALFICAYLSVGFQPVARPADDPEPVAQEQQVEQEPAEDSRARRARAHRHDRDLHRRRAG